MDRAPRRAFAFAACVACVVALCLTSGSALAQDAPCEIDEALNRAADTLLDETAEFGPVDLLVAAREAGSTAPVVRAVVLGPDDDARAATWLRERRTEADAPLICGEARDDSRRIVLSAVQAASLRVEGGRLFGDLRAGFVDPLLVIRLSGGELVHVRIGIADLSRGITLPDEADDRPALVQLVAAGPHGPRPVAELVIGGTAADIMPTAHGGDDLPERLRALRAARRAPDLRDNELLEHEAERHAEAVCNTGRVSHQREGIDPQSRLRREGIVARAVGEAVARGAGPAASMDALEASPSHLMSLTDRRFTDVGIATAEDESGRTCLVVLLSSWPRFIGR